MKTLGRFWRWSWRGWQGCFSSIFLFFPSFRMLFCLSPSLVLTSIDSKWFWFRFLSSKQLLTQFVLESPLIFPPLGPFRVLSSSNCFTIITGCPIIFSDQFDTSCWMRIYFLLLVASIFWFLWICLRFQESILTSKDNEEEARRRIESKKLIASQTLTVETRNSRLIRSDSLCLFEFFQVLCSPLLSPLGWFLRIRRHWDTKWQEWMRRRSSEAATHSFTDTSSCPLERKKNTERKEER